MAEQAQAIEINSNTAPVKNEARLREQVAKLQEEVKGKLQNEMKYTTQAAESSNQLSSLQEEKNAQVTTISNLRMELARSNEIVAHLQSEMENSKAITRLAEKQIDGLKDAIRVLQEENDETTKLNTRLVDERVAEKEKMAEQFNNMNDTIETLQKENAMLRSYAKNAKGGGAGSWFGGVRKGGESLLAAAKSATAADASNTDTPKRQWGATTAAVLPSQPLYTIKAHRDDASCVRYDGTNLNRVATASSDATVRVFDTSNGQLESTFSAGGRQPLLGVDIAGDIVCGCGADKTCRYVVTTESIYYILCNSLFPFTNWLSLECQSQSLESTNKAYDTSTSWTFPKDYMCSVISWRKKHNYRICRSINPSLGYISTCLQTNCDLST